MDSSTKSAIKSLVLTLRHTLEDELTLALKRYGIFTDQKWTPDAPPDRLTDAAEREAWRRIVTVIRRGTQEGRTLSQASADYIREAAFTLLNRLVGLKCLEVREIIPEIITTRELYSGRSLAHRDYRDANPREARAADDALPAAIQAACRQVNAELIGYLFDPDDDYSLIWPRYAVLKGCIEKINALDEAVWREDEIIGWLYQFYNAEEKVAVRRRGKPQTPHDVAVINQFFTPRWVVKFLVDNTLGRLWLEMHPDSARVRAKCDYLVPEVASSSVAGSSVAGSNAAGSREQVTDVATLATSATSATPATSATCYLLSDSPINNPAAPPRRPAKPVTAIRLLDPACGTMHFGHYACEVFAEMYRDSLDHGWPITSSKVASSKVAGSIEQDAPLLPATCYMLPDTIPTLILQHNLFGVDIDRRAVQLAALSLFMKARTLHPEAQVRQVNLVSADATLPDSGVKQKFLARYKDAPPVQRAFAQVLEDMDHVAQVGSLLRVEERLRELLTAAGYALSATGEMIPRRQHTIPGLEAPVRQLGFGEQADAGSGWTPGYTLQGLRDDLRAFARDALQEHDLNAQLFATEADKAVRLLDVLMGEYDVVVMNPPYGGTNPIAKKYLESVYPLTKNDLYAAFFERAVDFLSSNCGYFGALTSRTYLQLPTFEKLRRKILLSYSTPITIADFGFNVLDDAVVETAAGVYCAARKSHRTQIIFINLTHYSGEQRQDKLLQIIAASKLLGHSDVVYVTNPNVILKLPRSVFAYWAPNSLVDSFEQLPQMMDVLASAKTGLQTDNDFRFIRNHWEITGNSSGYVLKKWIPFAKGGDYSKYYSDVDLVVNWDRDGYDIKLGAKEKWGTVSKIVRNEDRYFAEGMTYTSTTVKGFSLRFMPSGSIFSLKGPGVFTYSPDDLWYVLGLLNSALIFSILRMLTPSRSFDVTALGLLPIAQSTELQKVSIESWSRLCYSIKATWDTGNELCTRFTEPWLLQLYRSANQRISESQGQPSGIETVLSLLGDAAPPSASSRQALLPLLDAVRAIEDAADARLQALQAQIDEAVYDLYEISPADRALIERELGDRPPEVVWPQMEGKPDKEKRCEHVRRLFSYYALQAARASDDGIVPLVGCAVRAPYLVERVRALLEAEFGPQAAYQLEQDAAAYLGRPLEDWLHGVSFREFHVKLYKNRPILWRIASPKGYFAALVDYHRLTRDTLPKVRTHYLWPQMESARTRLAAAKAHGESPKAIGDLEDELADLAACDAALESVIQGAVEVKLPEWAVGPYRNGQAPYDPELDDGVVVNLLPVQAAGLVGKKIV